MKNKRLKRRVRLVEVF